MKTKDDNDWDDEESTKELANINKQIKRDNFEFVLLIFLFVFLMTLAVTRKE